MKFLIEMIEKDQNILQYKIQKMTLCQIIHSLKKMEKW